MNELIFKLSEFECIKIITENDVDFNTVDFCCSELFVYFINNSLQQKLCVGQDSAGLIFEAFIKHLKAGINNKLQLHESITKNLGFMENEYYHQFPHEKPQFVMIPSSSGETSYWVGSNYEVWNVSGAAKQYVNTWLYNDLNKNIIFEATPLYRWSFQEREADDLDFITYDEFMKSYQPLLHRVIPQEVALTWLDQSMKIYRSFFTSEENYTRACKENNW